MATNAINSLSHAEQLNNEINHLFSKSSALEFSDPSTEEWLNAIEKINAENSVGLTSSEVKEKTRLLAEISKGPSN